MRWVVALCMSLLACGEAPPDPVDDAGNDNVVIMNPDGSVPPKDAGPPRMQKHDGIVLKSMQLGIVYIGDSDAGAAPNEDIILKWLLVSPYWLNLEEYGITNGNLVGTAHIPVSTLVGPNDLDALGLVDVLLLQSRIATAINGDPDAGTPATVSFPGAQA